MSIGKHKQNISIQDATASALFNFWESERGKLKDRVVHQPSCSSAILFNA